MRRSKIKVLIADIDERNRKCLCGHLTRSGYQVCTARSGRDLLMECETRPPDLFILNWDLPDLDGCDVSEHIRHYQEIWETPIIFLMEGEHYEERALGQMVDFVGGDYYLTKPCDRNVLLRLVDSIVEQSSSYIGQGSPRFPTRVRWPTKQSPRPVALGL